NIIIQRICFNGEAGSQHRCNQISRFHHKGPEGISFDIKKCLACKVQFPYSISKFGIEDNGRAGIQHYMTSVTKYDRHSRGLRIDDLTVSKVRSAYHEILSCLPDVIRI